MLRDLLAQRFFLKGIMRKKMGARASILKNIILTTHEHYIF
jgi:hypothetical protein